MARLYRRKDSPYWWCQGYDVNGVRWETSTKQSSQRAAEKAARAIERERLEGDEGKLAPITVHDALEALRTHRERKRCRPGTLEKLAQKRVHLERLFGPSANVHALTLASFEAYLDARRKEAVQRVDLAMEGGKLARTEREQPTSDHTIAMELSIMCAALRRLKRHELYAGDPAALWPEELSEGVYTPRDRWLPVNEYRELLFALSPHRQRYLTAYCYSGVRFSELYQSERVGNTLHVTQTKGNARVGETRIREVPLHDELRAVLNTTPLPWPRWQRGRMGDDLKRACARIGIARVSANDLRRTFVSWLCNAGVPELTVVKLVGHNSSAMVRRVYAQLAPATLEDAIARLPALGGVVRMIRGEKS